MGKPRENLPSCPTGLILASGSPRRAKILADLGVAFTVVKTDAPEVSYPHDPERTVRENALAKGAAAHARRVLSADTIVWYGNRIYGKPRDLDEAKEFLRELSGRTHTVFTGIAFDGDVKVVRSDVTFRPLTDALIDDYVARVKRRVRHRRVGRPDCRKLHGQLREHHGPARRAGARVAGMLTPGGD